MIAPAVKRKILSGENQVQWPRHLTAPSSARLAAIRSVIPAPGVEQTPPVKDTIKMSTAVAGVCTRRPASTTCSKTANDTQPRVFRVITGAFTTSLHRCRQQVAPAPPVHLLRMQ